ncbi:hypothetical protein [Streptomyces anulatus]|uniref:hypothetical protein n=1 Tax=Streptomyces anulatus TaxID=1892 RepID=UPI0036656C8A
MSENFPGYRPLTGDTVHITASREEPDRLRVLGVGDTGQMTGQPALEQADVLVDGG